MSCFYVCLVRRRQYSAEIEEMSDVVVQIVNDAVLGIRNQFGNTEDAPSLIRDAMEGLPPKELYTPEQPKDKAISDDGIALRDIGPGESVAVNLDALKDRPSGQISELEQKMVDQAESVLTKLEGDVAAGDSFPQYWTAAFHDSLFVRRDSKSSCTVFKKDGIELKRPWQPVDENCGRRLLTEAEALALLTPKNDPEDWVTQDRVPARPGIDQEQWHGKVWIQWRDISDTGIAVRSAMRHGDKDRVGDTLSLRCRRKDLPVVVQNVDEDWVELPPEHELRKGIDQILFSDGDWHVVDGFAGATVEEFGDKARCLRKDLPPIEPQSAPIAAVAEQPPEARYVVQQRTNVRAWMNDEIRWSTWPEGHWEAAGYEFESMRHGCRDGNAVLSVRCLEHNLPELKQTMLYRDIRPYEELPSINDEVPSNQQLFEMIVHLRDQMEILKQLAFRDAEKKN